MATILKSLNSITSMIEDTAEFFRKAEKYNLTNTQTWDLIEAKKKEAADDGDHVAALTAAMIEYEQIHRDMSE